MIARRHLLLLAVCIASHGIASVCAADGLRASAVEAPNHRPNVLFIAVDDLRTELGCYGVPDARSPHLDRLASEGVLFTNHFVQVPTCGASRYAMLTGRSPKNSGVTRNNLAFYRGDSALSAERTEFAQTMPELFRRNGYRTVCIGKISHTGDGKVYEYDGTGDGREEMPHAWDELATPYGSWDRGWGIFFAYTGGRHREDGMGHQDLMEFAAERDEDLPDGLMAQAAIDKLKELQSREEPFFLGLGFFKPHLPFVATKADWKALSAVDVQPPAHPERVDSPYWHKSGEFYKYDMPLEKSRPLSKDDAIMARRAYLACVRYVDRQIGKVLTALDDAGLRESTVVVVWGDHGWHLGESALWGKHSPFERALRSTLIIRAPGSPRNGRSCTALAESLDLYPTLIELCDLPDRDTQHPLDGQSLKSLLAGESADINRPVISYWNNAVSVRTATHRLIARKRDGEYDLNSVELYDVTKTPDPVENIAADQPELVRELLKEVEE